MGDSIRRPRLIASCFPQRDQERAPDDTVEPGGLPRRDRGDPRRRAGARTGCAPVQLGRGRAPIAQPGGLDAGARRLPPGQGRPLHLQPSRLHGGRLGRHQGGARPRQRELPLSLRGAPLPAGERRRGVRDRAPGFRAAAREHPRRSAEAARDPGGARAGFARDGRIARRRRLRDGRGRGPPRAGGDAQRRRPHAALHRRHHRHAEGRDVAPARSLPPPGGRRAGAAAGRHGRAARVRARRPAPALHAGRSPADARHRLVHGGDRLADRRLGLHARRSQALRPGGPVGRGRRARSSPRSRSSAIRSRSRWFASWRRTERNTTSPRSG